MILSGDFNFNISLPKVEPLIAFLNDELKLEINTNQNVSTTNSSTGIDAVFQRVLNTLKSQVVRAAPSGALLLDYQRQLEV
ncbi:hypothetical protein TNCV_2139631 [Trichonephila clavipes]|uniref:Uncharacterized protein n=1 Tax=Trichonephila clavipes TaxID=2585209 RepID=A0A8X6RTZ4_TRICX|nr:hypothetical protein TNCV_2139631 [Trichonephila clavipes]